MYIRQTASGFSLYKILFSCKASGKTSVYVPLDCPPGPGPPSFGGASPGGPMTNYGPHRLGRSVYGSTGPIYHFFIIIFLFIAVDCSV